MVRRWSHINTINLIFSKFTKFEKKHKIVTFKASVNFKRFTFKLTKFRRKSIARFKHTSSWLMYTNVIKFWCIDYMLGRHFCKVQFLNQIFTGNSFVYNFNFTKIRNDLFSYNFNFFLSTWTRKSYFYYNKKQFNFLNNNITFIWYNEIPLLSNSVKTSYSLWDNTLYPILLTKIDKPNSTFFELNKLFDNFFELNLTQLVEFKKILTLLFFFNLNFKSVK